MKYFNSSFLFFIALLISLSAFTLIENNLPKSAWKKVDKHISKLWPNEVIEKEQVKNEEYQLFKLNKDDELVGYLFLSKAPSRYDNFDYMLIYTPELEIKVAEILVYRESYGGEIGSIRWLKQFIGHKKGNDFMLGRDIQGISGATISCQAAAQGFKKSTLILNDLRLAGEL